MQWDLVAVILYDSIYNKYKIVKKCKIANIISYQYWEQFCLHLYIVSGCVVACGQHKAVNTLKYKSIWVRRYVDCYIYENHSDAFGVFGDFEYTSSFQP